MIVIISNQIFSDDFMRNGINLLKVRFALLEKMFICFNESPLKMMKNAFYFILKALFVFKISKFLSWLFGPVEKMARLERLG